MIQVDDLIAPELDGHVARALRIGGVIVNEGSSPQFVRRYFAKGNHNGPKYSPSTDWSLAGPLIESFHITLAAVGSAEQMWLAEIGGTKPDSGVEVGPGKHQAKGPTALVAAMRAFVRFNFGDEVPGDAP